MPPQSLIKEFLANNASAEPALFDNPDLMVADLALDSLTLLEMVLEMEDIYGSQVSDPMRYKKMSFKDMVASLENEVRSHHHGALSGLATPGQ